MNSLTVPIKNSQPAYHVFGFLLFSGVIPWIVPSALAQNPPQGTAYGESRPKTQDAATPIANAKKETAPASSDAAENKLGLQHSGRGSKCDRRNRYYACGCTVSYARAQIKPACSIPPSD